MTLTATPTTEETADEITASAQTMWDAVSAALPRAGVAAAIIVVGWAVSRLIRLVARRSFGSRRSPSFARVMSKLTGWLFLFVVVLIAIAVTFPSVKPVDLLAGLGFFSVAVGFAFQDILENTLSGVLLLFRQPFASGDQIQVEQHVGTVEGITIRETRITTYDGELVIIPNRDVYKSAIRVQTAHDRLRTSFVVGIAYENDAAEAQQVIMHTICDVDGVVADPAPTAQVSELGVSTIDIEVRFWSRPAQAERLEVLDRAIRAVKVALDRAGIEMPADIVALQATPSFRAALQGDDVTPGGAVTT